MEPSVSSIGIGWGLETGGFGGVDEESDWIQSPESRKEPTAEGNNGCRRSGEGVVNGGESNGLDSEKRGEVQWRG